MQGFLRATACRVPGAAAPAMARAVIGAPDGDTPPAGTRFFPSRVPLRRRGRGEGWGGGRRHSPACPVRAVDAAGCCRARAGLCPVDLATALVVRGRHRVSRESQAHPCRRTRRPARVAASRCGEGALAVARTSGGVEVRRAAAAAVGCGSVLSRRSHGGGAPASPAIGGRRDNDGEDKGPDAAVDGEEYGDERGRSERNE